MRLERSLNGEWGFQLDPTGTLQSNSVTPDRRIPVPMPWQAAFPELERYSGYGWYQHTFTLDDDWLAGEVLLDFGAVDYWCQVYVNGECVGEHEGGYTPFRLRVRRFVQRGENTLHLRVYDVAQESIIIPRWRDQPTPLSGGQPPFMPENIPHGKQTWYIDASGIWQKVTLLAVPARYIDKVHVTPNITTGEAQVRVVFGGQQQSGTLRVTIAGQTAEAPIAYDSAETTLTVTIANPDLWTPETPTLYTADVMLTLDGGEDSVEARFGFREISTRDGMLLLNGNPVYLLCALDQDLYPDTIYTVPSDDFLRDQFRKAKELGLNSLRCHIKPPDPRYLDIADEMGLLIWAEIPSWRTFYPKTTVFSSALYLDEEIITRVHDTLEDMIARDYNHPSLIIWSIVNEDWGTALLLSEPDRAFVAHMVDVCKSLDPTRLVVDNSPCPAPWGLSVHVKSDLDDFHIYANIPEQAESFEQFVEQFGLRPLWSFSNTGDAQRTGTEPIILSEFGNWGLPSLRRYNGKEPGWFGIGAWWSSWDGEPGFAMGAVKRFHEFGLDAVWRDYEAMTEATQWHQFAALKFEIEAMRRQATLQGYVITEFSDIYWESNGLLDFARGEKVFHRDFASFNAPDVIVPHLTRYAYWEGETARVSLHASHYSTADWGSATARATANDQAVFSASVESIGRGEVRDLGTATWRFAPVEKATLQTLDLQIENGGNSTLAHNQVTALVFPAQFRQAAYIEEVAVVITPERGQEAAPLTAAHVEANSSNVGIGEEESSPESAATFVSRLRRLGYQTVSTPTANTRLIITDSPTAEMLAWVRNGGDMLFLSSHAASPFFWRQGRGGTYSGNWATSFSWLRPDIYRRLQAPNPVSMPFTDVMPLGVILGLPVEDETAHGDFLAGQFSGWLRHPALHTVQFRYGQGRVIMTTYRLRETLGYQPVAVAMLHDLVDHLTSEACQPTLKANYG